MALYLILGFLALCVFGPVLGYYFERRMIWPYSSPESFDESAVLHPYLRRQFMDARKLGFEILGKSRDLKGKAYDVDYYFAVSPQRDALAIIGTGTILRIPIQGIWLYSLGHDECGFCSVNQQACVEQDLTGKWKNQLVFDAHLDRLYEAHQAWLQKQRFAIKFLGVGRELADFRHAREGRIEFMVRNGMARRTEMNPEYWKYSLTGAFKCGVSGYFIGMYRAIKGGRIG